MNQLIDISHHGRSRFRHHEMGAIRGRDTFSTNGGRHNWNATGHGIQHFDLHATVPIAPWEAMLGGQVDLRLPDGKSVRLTIPVRSQNEQKLRVKGKGLPESATERGDVIIELQVMLPKEVSPREQELWEELKQASSFNPRMR